jgi:hypothetical protein
VKKRKPRPGSQPLKRVDASELPLDGFDPKAALPPWATEEGRRANEKAQCDANLTALGKARAKVEELAGNVRSDAFEDWVRRSVVTAEVPAEWTQARILYENYLEHAKTYGNNRTQKAVAKQELATETQWGRMMATMLPKKRRTAGWYYTLRCKRGKAE